MEKPNLSNVDKNSWELAWTWSKISVNTLVTGL